jgi:hypothetical protein
MGLSQVQQLDIQTSFFFQIDMNVRLLKNKARVCNHRP